MNPGESIERPHYSFSEEERSDLVEANNLTGFLQNHKEMAHSGTVRTYIHYLMFYSPEEYFVSPFRPEKIKSKLEAIEKMQAAKDWDDPAIDQALEQLSQILEKYRN